MNKQDAEKLLLALVGAYVWVASSDFGVDNKEFKKFTHVILESPFATHFTEENIRHVFKDTVDMFQQDFNAAMRLTLERIKPYKKSPAVAEEVIRLARAALVADAQMDLSEENALAIIEDELG